MIAQGRQETPGGTTDRFIKRFNRKPTQKNNRPGAPTRRRREAQLIDLYVFIENQYKNYRPGAPGDAGRRN